MQRRTFLSTAGVVSLGGLAGCTGGGRSVDPFEATSPAFEDGDTLPRRFTCDGEGVSPPFEIRNPPEPTATLLIQAVVIAGPANEATLWSLWNVPPDTAEIPAALPNEPEVPSLDGARQGTSRTGVVGYKPPCPDVEETEYYFQVYALEEGLSVDAGASHDSVSEAREGLVLASDRTTVSYAPQS